MRNSDRKIKECSGTIDTAEPYNPEKKLKNNKFKEHSWWLYHVEAHQNIRALTCGSQQCGILESVISDEPLQPPLRLETQNDDWSVA